MKTPKAPVMPKKPIQPSEYLNVNKECYSISDGTSLFDILAATNGIDPKDVKFISTSGYYDDYYYQFEWPGKPKRNPNYDKAMIIYQKKMEKYNQDMIIYKEKIKQYNSDQKEYLKWFYEKELKKLKD